MKAPLSEKKEKEKEKLGGGKLETVKCKWPNNGKFLSRTHCKRRMVSLL